MRGPPPSIALDGEHFPSCMLLQARKRKRPGGVEHLRGFLLFLVDATIAMNGMVNLLLDKEEHPLQPGESFERHPKASFHTIRCVCPAELTKTLFMSMLVSYLGYFQYGYILIMMTNPISVPVSNLTKEEVQRKKGVDAIPVGVFFPIGGVFGIILFTCLVDRYGRKCLLVFNNIFVLFALGFFCTANAIQLLKFAIVANLLAGITAGTFSCVVPLYLLEISPTPVRGAMTSTSAFFFNLSFLFYNVLKLPWILGHKEGFSYLAAIPCVVSTTSLLLLLNCPESPRFIFIQKKNEIKAREVLKSLRTQEDIGNEIRELQEEDFYEVMANEKKMTLRKFLSVEKFQGALITIIVLMAGNQLSGISEMSTYTAGVYKAMDVSMDIKEIIVINTFAVFLVIIAYSISMIDKWGRRILLITGFMICSMTCILLTFTLEFQVDNFLMATSSLLFITIFGIGYMLGPGSISLLIVGELFLQSSRSLAITVGFTAMWLARITSVYAHTKLEALLGSYALLACWPISVATFIYLFKMLPETKGKTFLQVQFALKEQK
ncbi:solute carrier family 2, facilitated glucose transporter member 5-like [Erythrolamprus reginae]|uniref:solute carrier family 2, facilitated glucose transporter member 5-like n=1 Tax=Erythrolamprus reginae TaxID=121349 RepID=UPI00396C7DA6